MAVPSPSFNVKSGSKSWSKLATPELPLLEGAASELAGMCQLDLLPAAAVDCCQDREETETPATQAPASPNDLEAMTKNSEGSDEEDGQTSFFMHEELPDVMSPDRAIFIRNGFLDEAPQASGRLRRATSDTCLLEMEVSGLTEVDLADLHRPLPLPPAAVDPRTAVEEPQWAEEGTYVPWWCRVETGKSGDQLITPLVDGRADSPAAQSAEGKDRMLLWCWVQPDGEGRLSVVPCTGAPEAAESRPHEEELPPPTEAELMCAPAAPPAGAYKPEWTPGAGGRDPTTLVISNLPAELETEDLEEWLDKLEFSGFYDFLFIPAMESMTGGERRFAVVNLTRHEYGLALAAKLHGKSNWGEDIGDGTCKCAVTWSTSVQGRSALIECFSQEEGAADEEVPEERPMLLSGGWQVPFPPPSA